MWTAPCQVDNWKNIKFLLPVANPTGSFYTTSKYLKDYLERPTIKSQVDNGKNQKKLS